MTRRNPQLLLQSMHDILCSTQRTRRRCANLQKVLSDRLTIEHGVKCSYFVNSHRWHFKDSCDFVHDTDTRPSQLSLPEIQERYHCCLFVLRWIFTGMLAFNYDRENTWWFVLLVSCFRGWMKKESVDCCLEYRDAGWWVCFDFWRLTTKIASLLRWIEEWIERLQGTMHPILTDNEWIEFGPPRRNSGDMAEATSLVDMMTSWTDFGRCLGLVKLGWNLLPIVQKKKFIATSRPPKGDAMKTPILRWQSMDKADKKVFR